MLFYEGLVFLPVYRSIKATVYLKARIFNTFSTMDCKKTKHDIEIHFFYKFHFFCFLFNKIKVEKVRLIYIDFKKPSYASLWKKHIRFVKFIYFVYVFVISFNRYSMVVLF